MPVIAITGDTDADELLATNPFALLAGMQLDQQFPMEAAFAGPAKVVARMGGFEAATIAATDLAEFKELCSRTPAIHRFPGSMATKLHALAGIVRDEHDGDASRIWTEATSGPDLLKRIQALPGFGKQKAQIFVALLAKQFDVRPDGWEKAAGRYAEDGFRSVADVVDEVSLQKVRDFKKAEKAAKKAAAQPSS